MPTSSTHAIGTHPSPTAAQALGDCASYMDAEEIMGATDCPRGCEVEPDGICQHGWESAGLTAGLI